MIRADNFLFHLLFIRNIICSCKILYPELTFLSLYRIIKYYSFKNIFKKEVIIHAR